MWRLLVVFSLFNLQNSFAEIQSIDEGLGAAKGISVQDIAHSETTPSGRQSAPATSSEGAGADATSECSFSRPASSSSSIPIPSVGASSSPYRIY